jgi:hypothetical protein
LIHLTSFAPPSSLDMPPHSRFESLPAELLSGILTRCSRKELINLAQTHSNLRAACRQELVNYPLTMLITSKSLKFWVAYFRKENTLLTQGARSLDIMVAVKMQDLLDAFDDVDPTVFGVNARPIHPDATRVFPLPSSLRKLSLKLNRMPGPGVSSDTLLYLLLRSLPERCPYIEELSIKASPENPSDEFDKCIRRLTHLRKLHLHVPNLPRISNRLSLLPGSLNDLYLWVGDIQTQEEVTTTVPWAHGIRKVAFAACASQGTANILMILSRGGATHLTELVIREDRYGAAPVTMMPSQETLTVGLQEFSLLQPPLRKLILTDPSAWSNSLHLPLLHTAAAFTLTQLSLQGVDTCIFPSHLPWSRLQSLNLRSIPKMGYQGPLTEPIFLVLTSIIMGEIHEIQTPEDFFPALETIKWQSAIAPEQVASLIRHDIKRIDIFVDYDDDLYELLWEAMDGHTIDLIALEGRFPEWIEKPSDNGERIFPEFPNIREFIVSCF